MNAWFWKERLTTHRRIQEGTLDGMQAFGALLLPVLIPLLFIAPGAVPAMGFGATLLFTTMFAIKSTSSVFTTDRELNATEVTGTLPTTAWQQVVGRWAGASLPAFGVWCLFLVIVSLSFFAGLEAFFTALSAWWLFGVWLAVVTSAGIFCSMILPTAARATTTTTVLGLLCVGWLISDLAGKQASPDVTEGALFVLRYTAVGLVLSTAFLFATSRALGRTWRAARPARRRRRVPLLRSSWQRNPIFAAHVSRIGIANLAACFLAFSTLAGALAAPYALAAGLPLLWIFTLIEAIVNGAYWLDREERQNRWDVLCATGIRPRTVVVGVVAVAVREQAVEWIVPLPIWIALAVSSGQPLTLLWVVVQPALTVVGALLGLSARPRANTGYEASSATLFSGIVFTGIALCVLGLVPFSHEVWPLLTTPVLTVGIAGAALALAFGLYTSAITTTAARMMRAPR